jgi:tRNA-specific 2-thiouridylase
MTKKVLVAMSGGVDSTIAAWKLKEDGYHVTGIHFRFWKWQGIDADYENEVIRLQRLADQIGINLIEVDAREGFKSEVIGQMLDQLGKGLTPNPCIHCNPSMKFSKLMEHADEGLIDLIATGHYVITKGNTDGRVGVYKASDHSKDQSYFLCRLDQKVFRRSIFPLGDTNKVENIQLAAELGLSFEDNPESQDLCFLTNQSYANFINTELPDIMMPGEIRDTSGKVIGLHRGLPNYTIGQRKGIEIAAEKPYFVVFKDSEHNELIVGSAEDLKFRQMKVAGVNWISGNLADHLFCNVKIRYRSPDYECEITRIAHSDYSVNFSQDIRDITPGQYAVFYNDDEMLGGGMIQSVENYYV